MSGLRRVAVVFGSAVLGLAGTSTAAEAVERVPAPAPDEAFQCFFGGLDAGPTTYEATVETIDGSITFFTNADGTYTRVLVRRVYDAVEYTREVGAPTGPPVVYVTGQQMIMLEWAVPQVFGEEPSEEIVSGVFQVPRMEIRDADGGLVDTFGYRLQADDGEDLSIVHTRGTCGDGANIQAGW